MARGFHAHDRAVLRVAGPDARSFLQGLVSNDVSRLDQGAVYAALLSPQGKYLHDFLLVADGPDVLVDVKADRAAVLAQRLGMYRLRAQVTIAPTDLAVAVALDAAPEAESALVVADPRDPALGWRAYAPDPAPLLAGLAPVAPEAWLRLRVERLIPETGVELIPDETYILEVGFERLNGVDFRKGCYVGQEIVARMKHKTELKKALVQVRIEGKTPPPGTTIMAGDRVAGTLYSAMEGLGLAHLRLDRAAVGMCAATARLALLQPVRAPLATQP